MRDQLIEGCLSLRLQLKLLERGNELSLDVALQMARCNEAFIQQATEMQADNVNKINVKSAHNSKMASQSRDTAHHRQPTKTERDRKYGKGRNEGHISKDECCPARKERCRKCGHIRHFAKVCRSKSKNKYQTKVFSVVYNESLDDEISAIELSLEDEPEVKLTIGGQEVDMFIDSGLLQCNRPSTMGATPIEWNQMLKPVGNRSIQSYATANKVQVEAKLLSKVELGEKHLSDVEFLVISNKSRPILRRKTAMQLGVLAIKVPESKANLVEGKFQELFSDKVGKLTNYSVELHLKPDAKFVAQPCRHVPYSLHSKVEEKLTELEDMDITERVEGPTPCQPDCCHS